ncbi:MAG: triphosphoribosyl-dephospho-CoA synthase [Clostridia bacterium]
MMQNILDARAETFSFQHAQEMGNHMAQEIGLLAHQALILEVNTTPKPGLVDQRNCGAHKDMDISLFYRSAVAIAPYFIRFAAQGYREAKLQEEGLLAGIRHIGIEAEQTMLSITCGVNTHKGAIFTLGILNYCCGRLIAQQHALTPRLICATAGHICKGIEKELLDLPPDTHGACCHRIYGMNGIRGEAANGFPSILLYALPSLSDRNGSDNERSCLALLHLIAHVEDTNVYFRTGRAGAEYCKRAARSFLSRYHPGCSDWLPALLALDDDCIERNLSPGGCADLLSAAWFLYKVQDLSLE